MKPKWLVVSHDAGGAEIVSAWVAAHPENEYAFLLQGPAVSVFSRKHPSMVLQPLASLESDVNQYQTVLLGTSWASHLERECLALCYKHGVRTVSYLDHWNYFKRRFETAGKVQLPSEIWVGDKYALAIAQSEFPNAQVRFEENLFLKELLTKTKSFENKKSSRATQVLYVSEPTRDFEKSGFDTLGYDEFSALIGYLEHLSKNAEEIESIRFRPHPAENPNKYDEILKRFSDRFRIETSHGRPLEEDLAWSDSVVGCDSMVMALGVFAGKKVYCCIPKGGRALTLPFPEIISVF